MPLNSTNQFHDSLHRWYGQCGRKDLPWRTTDDPYAIYISEVMLQQTQVKTVLERYYWPFLERFPTLKTLADAPQDEVLRYWQGLGYYNRAINLHKAAKASGGELPDSYDELIALPGIGQNTAHAILAFAFHQPVVVLEANVKRIVHRIFSLEKASPASLWEHATQLVDRTSPFDYNQAMMDLGAIICTPKHPACESCPAFYICKGKHTPERYPAPKQRRTPPTRKKNILVFRDANYRYHLRPRKTKFLNGLYGFIETDSHIKHYEAFGLHFELKESQQIGKISQTYSHFRLQATAYLITLDKKINDHDWHHQKELTKLPMSRADEKVVTLLK